MNRLLFVLIGIGSLVLVVFLFVSFREQKVDKPTEPIEQTEIPTPTQTLTTISSIPSPNSQDIPPNITLRITFNVEFNINSASVRFTPAIAYQIDKVSNILFIDPVIDLLPNTKYTVTVLIAGMPSPYTLSFTTASENPLGTAPDAEALLEHEESLRQNAPDAYLANKLPYSTIDFSAREDIRQSTNTLYFIVELSGDSQTAKNAFIAWLKSLGLTDTQIQGLDIEYR